MKKIIPVLLCVLLIGALALSVSAEGSNVSITPSATTLERGNTFTVVANLTNTDNVNVGAIALSFDENVFELTGGSCHIENAALGQVGVNDKAGAFMLNSPTVLSGKLFTFNFRVKDNAAFGTYSINATASIGVSTAQKIDATGTTITIGCEHTCGEWSKLDNDKHQRICSKCRTPEIEEHDWIDGNVVTPQTCKTPGQVALTCLFCAATKTEQIPALGHEWANDCDSTCNREGCGETRTVTHSDSSTWTSDASGHWRECTVCKDKNRFAAHTPGPAATEKTAQTCTVCSYEIKPAISHVHEISTEWLSDAYYHWRRCDKDACYYTEGKARHDYDDACDVNCNTCGAVREAPHSYYPEWRADASGHWHVCTLCSLKSDVMDHIPGPEATMTEPQICEECSFRIKMPLSHVHDYSETWYGDDESHWQSCAECAEATAMEPHAWEEGVELEDGGIQYTCIVCEMQVVTEEPMGTQPSTAPSTQAPTATQKPTEPEGDSRFPWEWAGVAAIVLLIIGVVLLIIEFIRSRKTNMQGKFSK